MSKKPSEYLKPIRNRRRIKLLQLAGNKCSVCGYDKCLQALEFHHKNKKEKKFSLSGIALTSHTWQEILNELLKCDLLCANGHAEVEAGMSHSK